MVRYASSVVCRYIEQPTSVGASSGGRAPPAGLHGWATSGCTLAFPAKGVYSMDLLDASLPLIAMAGADGQLCIYAAERSRLRAANKPQPPLQPLCTDKAHKGWIGDVQFASGQLDGQTRALTAANDASVVLWDLRPSLDAAERCGREATITSPYRVLATNKHLHAKGIFSLHEMAGSVLTAGKDGYAATCALTPTGFAGKRSFDVGMRMLKTARWRDAHSFACAGQSHDIAIIDTRAAESSGASLRIDNAHASGMVSDVRWSPCDEHLLLTSGKDMEMLLHDVRAPGRDVVRLRGHARSMAKRGNPIFTPTFSHGGRAVTALGHGSNRLSLFSVASGAMVWEASTKDERGQPRELMLDGAQVHALRFGGAGSAADEALVLADGKHVEILPPLAAR